MFRIRRVVDDTLPADRDAIEQVQNILRTRLAGVPEPEVAAIPDRLRDPLRHFFRTWLLVADDLGGKVKGFALLSHAPDLDFCFLDFIATDSLATSGVGGALYGRVREQCRALGAVGLFFECSPDDPAACKNPQSAAQNAVRLKFYERFGARPIIGTRYEQPLNPGDLDMPHLVFDDLGSGLALARAQAQTIIRAILERKYSELCPPEYVTQVVASVVDDPVRLRPPRYAPKSRAPELLLTGERRVILAVNDQHDIHHVRERGYVESPVRVRSILDKLEGGPLVLPVPTKEFPERWIRQVHDADFLDYLKRVCANLPSGRSVYPYVFPLRNVARPPKDLAYRAGYYCIDTFTPLNANAWRAARRAVDTTLTAAEKVLKGHRLAYALVRPPGHHAERRVFGGFCYLNNAAVAAQYFAGHGRVAILDIDYHHGNGQQDIFYERSDVFTASLHGDPSFAYPFFSGFAEERGQGPGEGYNLNLPLPERLDGKGYLAALKGVLGKISAFGPRFLVVCLGLDTAKGDPTGTWSLVAPDFEANGRAIGQLGLPTLLVQEGGYRSVSLGANARAFLTGLVAGAWGVD